MSDYSIEVLPFLPKDHTAIPNAELEAIRDIITGPYYAIVCETCSEDSLVALSKKLVARLPTKIDPIKILRGELAIRQTRKEELQDKPLMAAMEAAIKALEREAEGGR